MLDRFIGRINTHKIRLQPFVYNGNKVFTVCHVCENAVCRRFYLVYESKQHAIEEVYFMKFKLNPLLRFCCGFFLFVCMSVTQGLFASDNAGNYSSWSSEDNQGTGFGPWIFKSNDNGTAFAGVYLTDLTNPGNRNSGILLHDSFGKAFALSPAQRISLKWPPLGAQLFASQYGRCSPSCRKQSEDGRPASNPPSE
jgi:hypothetical protein